MKKIERLRLSNLSKQKVENREMKQLKGGFGCNDKCGTITPSLAEALNLWFAYF